MACASREAVVFAKRDHRNSCPTTQQAASRMTEREYKVMTALKGSAVPVAAVPLLCEDSTIIGTPFYVMDFLEGRIFRDPGLPSVAPTERAAIYRAMSDTMAALHAVD